MPDLCLIPLRLCLHLTIFTPLVSKVFNDLLFHVPLALTRLIRRVFMIVSQSCIEGEYKISVDKDGFWDMILFVNI